MYDQNSQEIFDIMFENQTVTFSEALQHLNLAASQHGNSSFWQPGSTYKPFRITENETYLCRFPDVNGKRANVSRELSAEEVSTILERGERLLDELYEQVLYKRNGYFLNLVYYGRNILQAPAELALSLYDHLGFFPFFNKPEQMSEFYYMLGRWSNKSVDGGSRQLSQLMPMLGPVKTDPHAPTGPLHTHSKFYIQQVLKNGSICDLNGKPRQTTIRVRLSWLMTVPLWQHCSFDNVG